MYNEIRHAYFDVFGKPVEEFQPNVSKEFLKDFPGLKILVFPPTRYYPVWIYATLGMFELGQEFPGEIHLFSEEKTSSSFEALSALIQFAASHDLKYGDIFPCEQERKRDNEECSYVALLYPLADGEGFPELNMNDKEIHFYWLLPVTSLEVAWIKENGMDAFEEKLLDKEASFFSWKRKSLIKS